MVLIVPKRSFHQIVPRCGKLCWYPHALKNHWYRNVEKYAGTLMYYTTNQHIISVAFFVWNFKTSVNLVTEFGFGFTEGIFFQLNGQND